MRGLFFLLLMLLTMRMAEAQGLVFTPDGRQVFYSIGPNVVVVNTKSGLVEKIIEVNATPLCITSDNQHAVFARLEEDKRSYDKNSTYMYWNLGQGQFDKSKEKERRRNWNYITVQGDVLVSYEYNYVTLGFLRLSDLVLINRTPELRDIGSSFNVVRPRPGKSGEHIRLDKDGRQLLLFSGSDKKLRSFSGHKLLTDAYFSNDGNTLVSAGDKTIIWDVEKGKKIREFANKSGEVQRIAISPDGSVICLRDAYGGLSLRDIMTGNELWQTPPTRANTERADWLSSIVRFSPDGAIVAHWTKGDSLALFDAKTGISVKEMQSKIAAESNTGLVRPDLVLAGTYVPEVVRTISSSGKYWASLDTAFTLKINDIRSGLPLKSIKTDRKAFTIEKGNFVFDINDRWICAGNQIYDIESGKLKGVLRYVDEKERDGKIGSQGYLVTTNYYDYVHIWDLETQDLARSIPGLYIGQGSSRVVTMDNGKVTVWNVETGKKEKSYAVDDIQHAATTDGKNIVTINYKGRMEIHDAATGKPVHQIQFPVQMEEMQIGRDGRFAVVKGYDSSLRVINLKMGTVEEKIKPERLFDEFNIGLPDSRFSTNLVLEYGFGYDDKIFYTLTEDRLLRKWEIGKLKPTILADSVVALAFDNRKNSTNQKILAYAKERRLFLLDMKNDKIVREWGTNGKVIQLAMSYDGYYVAAGMDMGFRDGQRDGHAQVWKTFTGEPLTDRYTVAYYPAKENLKFHPTRSFLAWTNIKPVSVKLQNMDFRYTEYIETVYVWDLSDKGLWEKESAQGKGGTNTRVNFSADGTWFYSYCGINYEIKYDGLYNRPYNYGTDWLGHNYQAHVLNDRALSAADNGMITLNDLKSKKWLNLYAPFRGSGYLYMNDEGYYTSTPGLGFGIGFVVGLKTYRFDQFDLQYNRPDLIFSSFDGASAELTAAYRRAYEKRIHRMGLKTGEFENALNFNVPVVQLNSENIPAKVNESKLSLNVQAADAAFPIIRFNVWVNSVPVYGMQGLSLGEGASMNVAKTLDIELVSGKNRVEVSAVNSKGVESIRERIDVQLETASVKNDLYIIAIGVSDFQQDYDLRYAAKDAGDFANEMARQQERFANIHRLMFLNRDATRQNILSAREALLKCKVDDEVMVFVASHGMLDDKLDYYIATHDVDFDNPSGKGLLYEDLEGLLDGIPARKKLLLIDACHSGEVDKTEVTLGENLSTGVNARAFKSVKSKSSSLGLANSFELMKELFADVRRGTGTVVLSAAAGKEYAFENAEWKNGVFTYSLLEGLKTLRADLDGNKEIRLSEMRDYVTKKVQEITGGKQNPTSRAENLDYDYRVY